MPQDLSYKENFYLLDFVKKNIITDPIIFDSLKFELDTQIYFYGQQYNNPREKWRLHFSALFNEKKIYPIPQRINRAFLRLSDIIADSRKKNVIPNTNLSLHNEGTSVGNPKIVSNAFFTANDELNKLGFNVILPPWATSSDKILTNPDLNRLIKIIYKVIYYGNFNDLINPRFIKRLYRTKDALKTLYLQKDIKALIVPIDIFLFENLSISIFKELRRPSYVFLHGLPVRYNSIDENRADYLVVWGDKIKENYVRAGIIKDKIFVSGHPLYQNFKLTSLKFDFKKILILTKSIDWCQYGENVILADRGNVILYLLQIKRVLQSLGVTSVRLRPHPAENIEWYYKFIDHSFFKLDREPLAKSLQKTTLVIGPTTTVFLEAIYYGVNFVVFEPSVNNVNMNNYLLFPPFDGSDDKVPVAKNEEELKEILLKKVGVNPSVFTEYVKTPFDLSFIKNLINSSPTNKIS